MTNCNDLFISVANLEEEAAKLVDAAGLMRIGDFLKYACSTDLMKVEFVDRVFSKVDFDNASKNSSQKQKVGPSRPF